MKKIIKALLASLMMISIFSFSPFSPFSPTEAEALWSGQAGTVIGSGVNVRTGPGTNFGTRGTVALGTTVLHLGSFQSAPDGWWENVRITSGPLNGVEGWIRGDFLGNWHTPGQGMNYNIMTRAQLAQEILNRYYGTSTTGRRITMPRWASNMTDANRRSAYMNIRDTANGLMATTRPERPNTHLNEDLLRAVLRMNDQYGTLQINAIAGGNHTGAANDEHYIGRAIDFQLNAGGLAGRTPASILTYLENTWGFRTQRNSGGQARNPNYHGNGTSLFHLEIWGRN